MTRLSNREVNTARLSRLYEGYADAIYRYCFFRVFSKAKAEELMQETFLRVWNYLENGKELTNEKSLLYTIATHLVIDMKRKAREGSLEDLLETSDAYEPVAAGGEGAVANRAMMREVREALATLGQDEQDLFAMRYVSDMDPKEIAEVAGTSANVVSVRLNRIMHKLRAKLA